MQVKLITIIETIIDASEHSPSYEEAKKEIYTGRFFERDDLDNVADDVKQAHVESVVYDSVRSQSVTHSFEEVK